jgi:hypothetical protein
MEQGLPAGLMYCTHVIIQKKLLGNKELDFKNGVMNIQNIGYNGKRMQCLMM